MLRLKGIKKDYVSGDMTVHALKGIDLTFRDSEFVSILGPSGCGKTTMLNIIGGLDHYTDGELFIDGISTKNYTDRDWDTYRNHRIGFVFQSYNLIPHQTISENVELALAISGVDKNERVRRAHEALDKVGLKDLYHKKPNQLSGGQCQRVAIARALVNDPEILLADEPTGALDTTTSVQIMELIKEISKDCLVIMVTHNPELAEKYSTRIIRLLDGEVQSDTMPCDENERQSTKTERKKTPSKKAKLSFFSTFRLSAKNLLSKLKRTLLVCLAGAIGIIGIASVLSVSEGVRGYIADMQNDMLSGNPITISEETMNLNLLMAKADGATGREAVKQSVEKGYVNVDSVIEYLVSRGGDLNELKVKNDISQEYLDYVYAMPKEYYSAISTDCGLDVTNGLYTDYDLSGYDEKIGLSLSAAQTVYTAMLKQTEYADYARFISMVSGTFMQAPDNADFILSQYDIIGGEKIATAANEIMIVVNNDYELSDVVLAQFGYYSQDEFLNLIYKAVGDDHYDPALDKRRFSYEELIGKTFTWYPNDVIFNQTDANSPLAAINPFTYNAYKGSDWTEGKTLTVTAILKQKDGLSYGCLDSGFYYTSAFAKQALEANLDSRIVSYLNEAGKESFTSMSYNSQNIGITYKYEYFVNGEKFSGTGFVGNSSMNGLISSITGNDAQSYTVTLRELGGRALPDTIRIYPVDFGYKDNVTAYISEWN
ncbi:MAG: ABC transporter ATP-binding protein, partial [Candidatus Neoclostridium sp.]